MPQNIQLRRHCHASSKPDLVETRGRNSAICSGEAFHLEHRRVRGTRHIGRRGTPRRRKHLKRGATALTLNLSICGPSLRCQGTQRARRRDGGWICCGAGAVDGRASVGLPTHVLAALDGGAAACEGALMRVEPSALLSTWRCSCLCARTGAFPDTMVGAAVPAVRSFLQTAYRRRLCGAAPLLAHHQLIHRDWASAIRCWQRPPFPGVGRARSAGADVPHRYVCELRRRGVVVACARACFAPVVAHVHTHRLV